MSKKSTIDNQVRVRIPNPEVWDDFQEFIHKRYGTNRVVTGMELQKAMEYHLGLEGWKDYPEKIEQGILADSKGAYTHVECSDDPLDPADRIMIQTIRENMDPGTEVNFNVLRKWWIRECNLKSRRAQKDHIDVLVAHGILEDLAGNYTVYKVLQPEGVE
jgi:hypothetical protein